MIFFTKMPMADILSFFLVILTFFSCTYNKNLKINKFVGIYSYTDKYYSSSKKLYLYDDFTFKYEEHTGLLNGITKGKWYISERFIILNSLKQYEKNSENFAIKSESLSNSDTIVWSFKDKNTEEDLLNLHICIGNINNDFFCIYKDSPCIFSKSELRKIQASTIRVNNIGYKQIDYTLLYSNINFIMYEYSNIDSYFNNKKCILKNKKIKLNGYNLIFSPLVNGK